MSAVQHVLETAVAWEEFQAAETEEKRAEHWDNCKELAEQPRILDAFAAAAAKMCVAGEVSLLKLLFLVLISRLLRRIVSIVLKGPSSGGKSYLVHSVLRFFPPEAFFLLTAMSERALIYTDEPFKHRFLVLCEAESLQEKFVRYIVRSLLSENCIRYITVEKTPAGLRPREIFKEGPTGLISTTTEVALHPESETRFVSVNVTDTPEQTKQILATTAERYAGLGFSGGPDDFKGWHALQHWLSLGEHGVVVPFAQVLASLIPPVAVRLRRDIDALLSLVSAHAILHQANRNRDKQNRIIATIDDYAAVRELLADVLSSSVETLVPCTIRDTVLVVRDLKEGNSASDITIKMVADELKVDKSSASRRVNAAIEKGYLVNRADKGRPANLTLGDPMPDDVEILPLPETVEKLIVASKAGPAEGGEQ